MKKRVLVTYNMLRDGYAELIENFDVTFPPEGVESFTYQQVKEIIGDYDVLQSMFNFNVDRWLLEAGAKGRLKAVSNYGVGFNNIDIDSATEFDIQVMNTPKSVVEPTADQAMGLLLSTSRRISEIDRRLRKDDVTVGLLENLGQSLYGLTIGIVGMGRIGQALARRAVASGMKVIYHNRKQLDKEIEERYGAMRVSLEELLKTSDIVSLNAPLNKETHHMISTKEFEIMKPTAILINTARGALVEESALIDALKRGLIWGAGVDVFEFGDYPMKELLELDNVVLSPHLGTQTIQTRNDMSREVSENIINFYNGREFSRVNCI